MPRKTKTRIEDLRRIELIDAAHRVFMLHGLSGMTTARICAEAGMSPGILSYYFKGKDEVLFAMVRKNNRALVEDVVLRLRQARTPAERLFAIIEGNFPEAYFHRNIASAWLSVCAASAVKPDYARLQRVFYRRLASNIASTLKDLVEPDRIPGIALSSGVQIDGLWLRKSVEPDLPREAAVQLVLDSVRRQIGLDPPLRRER
jgi:TetR/AcrR family transcriptional regulator, transcriptional repressor of bet genes